MIDSELAADRTGTIEADAGRSLPRPRRQMLYDVDVCDGAVAHQHVDHVYYATVPSRDIEPADGEESADAWDWYTEEALRESDLDADVVELGVEAISAAESRSD